MKTRNLFFLASLFILIQAADAQTRSDIREIFNQGEMYVLFEEYNEALPFYLDLNKLFPENYHYKYRIGQCYINIPGEKEKAIPYLEEAVQNISLKHREGRLREKYAPFDALYYLANAYRINNQLDHAIETYEKFLVSMDHTVYDSTIVEFQLQTCRNAKQMMDNPLYVRDKNMGDNFNDRYSESNPVVTAADDKLFFTRVLPFRRALFFSQYTDGSWSGPVDIIPDLNVDDKFYPSSVSKDGKTLYLYSDFDYIGNIYVSRLENNQWTPVEKLNENINTKYWESHASISPDGKKLYFSSNRKGGYGGLDIFVSELDTTGNWGPARNLGPVINTPYHEDTPFLTEDGKTMFFSSRGHYNMGGYDIFYSSNYSDTSWSVPLNAGYPLNTTDDDLFFMPLGKGYEGYIARFDEEGFGQQDIYRVEIFSDEHPRKFLIRGITRIEDLRSDLAESIRIVVKDINNPNMAIVVYTDPVTGKYEFEVKHGEYEVTFDADGTVTDIKRLILSLDHAGDTISMPVTELAKSDFEAVLRVLSDSLLMIKGTDTAKIDLYTEPKSILDILVMNEGKVIASERFSVTDTAFTYRFVPEQGKNVVDFTLTDMFMNTTTARVIVEKFKDQAAETITRPEYSRVIARRQISAFLEILKQNADNDLRRVISGIDPGKQQFGTIDDVVSHVRELAIAEGIESERVDKLALRTAVNNNILTQATVDYLERNVSGELKDILSAVNVYDEKMTAWSGLKGHVASSSGGRITGEMLDRLATYLLTGPDPAIAIIREKIGIYATTTDKNKFILDAISATDNLFIINAHEWLQTFHAKSLEKGLTEEELAIMYSVIGFAEGTSPEIGLSQIAKHAPEDLTDYINQLDLKKLRVRTVADMINLLLGNRDKEFKASGLFGSLAAVIAENDLPASQILGASRPGSGTAGIVLPIAGLFILILIIIFVRRKKRERDQK
ncbi:MAG: PD40 domain-containing protein [Bacteroidales bacterium]|nr:PD40 domain-containing protein [Bacteroidales bacterium]